MSQSSLLRAAIAAALLAPAALTAATAEPACVAETYTTVLQTCGHLRRISERQGPGAEFPGAPPGRQPDSQAWGRSHGRPPVLQSPRTRGHLVAGRALCG